MWVGVGVHELDRPLAEIGLVQRFAAAERDVDLLLGDQVARPVLVEGGGAAGRRALHGDRLDHAGRVVVVDDVAGLDVFGDAWLRSRFRISICALPAFPEALPRRLHDLDSLLAVQNGSRLRIDGHAAGDLGQRPSTASRAPGSSSSSALRPRRRSSATCSKCSTSKRPSYCLIRFRRPAARARPSP